MYVIGLLIALAAVAFGIFMNAIPLRQILDPASFIVILVPALGAGLSAGGLSGFARAFQTLFSQEATPEISRTASRLFRLMGNVSLGAGFIGTLIGCIYVLNNTGTAGFAVVARGMAAAILTLLYGAVFKYLVFLPAAVRCGMMSTTR